MGIAVQRHTQDGNTSLIQSRNIPLIGKVNLISRGPIGALDGQKNSHLQSLLETLKGPLIINGETGERPRGSAKLFSGKSLAMLDLDQPEMMRANLAQKWRNRLNKAERSGLVIVNQPLDRLRHEWFLKAEAEQQRERRYQGYPTALLLAFAKANKSQARLLSALDDGKPVAAILVLKHGRMATYQAGITTPEGRQHSAHHLLMWHAMSYLHKKGFEQFDLGRTDFGKGLTHFKMGTGAREMTLSGSFVMHRWFSRRRFDENQFKQTQTV